MHMAFLSRVFKNLQWYGMTAKILKPQWFQDFLLYLGQKCELMFGICSELARCP